MTDEAKGALGKKYRSLEEFDREFFPTSTDKVGTGRGETKRHAARLVRLVEGQLQEQSKRRPGGPGELPTATGEFGIPRS